MSQRNMEYLKSLLTTFNAVKQISGDEEAMYIVAAKVARDQNSQTSSDHSMNGHDTNARLVTEEYPRRAGTS